MFDEIDETVILRTAKPRHGREAVSGWGRAPEKDPLFATVISP
jgi:hypothetical protein